MKLIAGLLAALVLTGTAVVLAAGSARTTPPKAAAAPKTMSLACAHAPGGKLQYLPEGTKKCHGELLHFPKDAPVIACQLDKPNSLKLNRRSKLAPPAHRHNVPGMLFVVSSGAKCKPPKYPSSHAVTIPRPVRDLKLCAGKRRGTVRVVLDFSACNDLEHPVVLKHHQLAKPNHKPVANDDAGLTDKEHSTTIAVLANDTDADGDALHVAGVDTAGTKGSVTVKPSGKIEYDPAGKFDSLGPNDSAHDTFEYRATDGHASSGAATVDVTVAGVNHAPVLSGVESSALAYDTGTAARQVSGTIAVSDTDGGNLDRATVAITAGHVSPNDTLSVSPPSGIAASYDSSTGVLTLTGSAPASDYETALRDVRFAATDPTPSGSRTISFQVDDGNPLNHASNVVSRDVDVTNVPDPPSGLALSQSHVLENAAAGTSVGTFTTTDPDPGDTFTYSLVTGTGDDDNGSFQISGDTLKTGAVFDKETKSSYSIRVRTTDGQSNTLEKQFTITVDDANDAPTNIALSNASVTENKPAGTDVGTLSSTDQDGGDTHTYSLATGAGDDDNASFKITGDKLQTNAALDFETKSTYSVRVKTDDGHGGTFEKQFTITVDDANDAPTNLALSSASVNENLPAGTAVGSLSSTDQDTPGDSFTYSLVTGTGDDDNGSFQISGDTLKTGAVFDKETKSSYSIRVRTDDGKGGTFEKQLTITVGDVNDAPTGISLSDSSVGENMPAGTTVGGLSATDQDQPGDAFTFTLVSGTGDDDNGSFQVSGNSLQTKAVFDKETKASYSIRVKVDDGKGGTVEKQFTITVDDANDTPTNIALSNATVDENQPSGTAVGTLSSTDQDSGDTHTYTLVSGTGSTDNASFQIVGDTLKTNASLDFEAGGTRSVRIKTDDGHGGSLEKQFTVTVNDKNDAPTDISLSNAAVDENQPSGTTVGTLSSTDQDSADTQTYSLVTGTGDDDNASFQLSGSTLETNATFDRETKSSYSIRVKTDDGNGGTFEKALTISVNDVNEAPTDITLSDSSVAENSPLATTVGTFSTTDPETGDTQTYSLVTGTGDTDNASFTISGDALQTNTLIDFETKSSYSIRVKTDDGHGHSFEKQFTITVDDVNDAPTDLALSNASVNENEASGTAVGTLSSTDQDASDTHTYSLVTGTGDTDNASFQISGDTLETKASLDFEAGSTRSIRVKTDDGNGGSFEKQLTITIDDVNDAPTGISLSNSSVAENLATGATVGTLSSTDQDASDSHTYTLVAGTGSTDNSSFQISGDTLQTNATFDKETKSSYSIRVQTDDGHGGTFEKVFTISIDDANDAPTDLGLSSSSVAENQPTGTSVGSLSSTDQDSGDTHTYSLVTGTGDDDNGSFEISGSTLQTKAVFDFETKSSYTIRVKTDDGNGGTFEKQLTITVTDANDAPTDIALSKATIVSGKPTGETVGTLSSTDQDAGDTHTYSLVTGTGDDDNGSFQIDGDTLKTATSVPTGTYSVRIRSDDGHGGTFDEVFTITANPNSDPTDIGLSPSAVDENQPSGTTVGTFTTTDADAGDTFTYTLVSGTGSTDNGSFQIVGDTLKTNAALDFEAGATRSIRVQTNDGHGGTFEKAFTITVNDKNDAPTNILLSNSSVAENAGGAANVGTLSTTDQDSADSHTYSLATGTGDDDNGKFTISGGTTLQATQSFDFETKSSYSVRVKTDDGHGGTFEKQFTITVTDANDAPTDLALSPSSVPENSPLGTTVGNLSSTDQDSADTHTYTLVSGTGSTDNASFTINGTAVQTNALLDFETKPSYSIRVQTDDGHGGTFQKALTITVTDVNDAPTDISLSKSDVDENLASGATVGSFSSSDQDAGDTHTYTLATGTGDTDNGSFTIDGSGNLKTAASFNYEVKSSYSIRVKTDDGHGGTFEKQFTITVNNKNDAPTDIALSKADIDENQPSGTTIGTFSTTDEDVGDTFTYTLVAGTGSTDNSSFTIDASGHLKSAVSFNYEVKNSYSIRVRSTDSGSPSLSTEKVFTITVNDVNDPPTTVQDDYSGAIGNTKAQVGTSSSGPVVTLSGNIPIANDSDEDTTFPHTVSAVPETVSSTGGGSATINADGSFTYLPGVGDKNLANDTFTYHASDGSLTSPGTATVDIANELVWYVKAGAGGDGRSNAPFSGLGSLNGAGGAGDSDGSGDYIFLYGSSNYTGGLPLESSQKLFGEPNGLTVAGNALVPATGGAASNNPTIQNSGGDAIQLANGSDVERVNAGTSSGVGIKGTSVTTSTVGSTTTISGASGGAVALSGSAGGDIGIASNITNTAGKSVSVAGRTSGTVTLSGSIDDTGTGVSVSGNTGGTTAFTNGTKNLNTGTNPAVTVTSDGGHTVNFTGGGLNVDTTSGTGFNATSGTVTVSGTGNSINSSSATALNVTTTIGTALNFERIDSGNNTAAADPSDGIVLDGTGANAGLTVTGAGGTCTAANTAGCDGGTIQHTTGANSLSATPPGTGIVLNNTKSPSFTRMHITGNSNYGIHGSDVSGFTLDRSVFDGVNGDAGTVASVFYNDSAVLFDNPNSGGAALTGSASITNSSISGGYSNQVWVSNESGTLNRLTLDSDTFGANDTTNGNDAVSLEGLQSSTFNATVQKSTFTSAKGDVFQMVDNASGNGDLDWVDNTVSNNHPAIATGGGGVTLSGGAGSGTFDIDMHNSTSTNTFRDSHTNAITIQKSAGPGSLHGVLDAIHVGVAGIVNSGSLEGSGVQFKSQGGGAGTNSTLVVKNSDIRQYNNYGILNQAGTGIATSGNFNVTDSNNTIGNPGTNSAFDGLPFQGIYVNSGVTPGDAFQSCADIGGNTATASGRGGGTDMRVLARQNTTVRLPGYGGGNTDTTAVAAYLVARNTASTASAASPDPTSGGYVGGATCAQ